MSLFASAIKLSGGEAVPGEARIPGGRFTVVVMALTGLATTLAAIVLALVPAPGEQHPGLALLKIAGITLALLGIGLAVYLAGSRAARRAAID